MLLPVHCFDGDRMMILFALYLNFCQSPWIFPEIKLPPASDIISLGSQWSQKMALHASIKLSADSPSLFFDYWEITIIIYNTKTLLERTCLCWQLPMVFLKFHGGLISPSAALEKNYYMEFNISIYAYPKYGFYVSSLFSIPMWLWYSACNVCFCSSLSITIHLLFSIIQSIAAMYSLNV